MENVTEWAPEDPGDRPGEPVAPQPVELDQFRQDWQREVQARSQAPSRPDPRPPAPPALGAWESQPEFQQARALYLAAVRLEHDGDLHDAVREYRKAFALVPDIDRIHYENSHAQPIPPSRTLGTDMVPTQIQSPPPEEYGYQPEADAWSDDLTPEADLAMSFSRLDTADIRIEPARTTAKTHVGQLPTEVHLLIIKWMVSNHLDLLSLKNFSAVCRQFYLLSRAEEIWRLICRSTWGQTFENRSSGLSWRDFYITQPRIRLDGCYIAKSSYARQGERGFQDTKSTRTWHIVRYFRYVRFFPEGRMAMTTSADQPKNVVRTLSMSSAPPQGTLVGLFKVKGNVVFGTLRPFKKELTRNPKRGPKRTTVQSPSPNQEFHFEMEIVGHRMRRLTWRKYQVLTKSPNGPNQWSDFDASHRDNYPPLIFSRVNSYVLHSGAPLS